MEEKLHAIIANPKGESVGIAESCTGGLVSSTLTAFPGASALFRGSVVAYDNRVKRALLKVPSEILQNNGAVSLECALCMAKGIQNLLEVTVAAAVTGVAGPSGGTPFSPVGTVYLALIKGPHTFGGRFWFEGERTQVQQRAAETLLYGIVSLLTNEIPNGFSRC